MATTMQYFKNKVGNLFAVPENGVIDIKKYPDLESISQEEYLSRQEVQKTQLEAEFNLLPKPAEFARQIQIAMGDIISYNKLIMAYPVLPSCIKSSSWDDVTFLITDAYITGVITLEKYVAIGIAASRCNLPVSLPV